MISAKKAYDVYSLVDNGLYDAEGDIWRRPNSPLCLIRYSVNPARVGYIREILHERCAEPFGKSALEVGCGGGILSEEIARMGYNVTGVDPSGPSLQTAAEHARAGGLRIRYQEGTGESIPYPDGTADAVFCCDVLEHVCDLPKVISEIRRVLKPGGYFFYDTLNRTVLSRLVAIKIAQEWKTWAFAPPNLHDWRRFIRPDEMKTLLEENHLEWKEHRGMRPDVSFPARLFSLKKRAVGKLNYKELGEKVHMAAGKSMGIMYMGYAVKNG
jgi:2-polyprenyl-6-hydroxyphenyl methylase/3-demethylubiquinone-9 3-methyltransferase